MDGDNGSSIAGTATGILGVFLLGSMILYGLFVSGSAGHDLIPKPDVVDALGNPVVGLVLFASALIAGYAAQGIGFPLVHQVFFRKVLKWNPSIDLISDSYKPRFWARFFGRPRRYDEAFRKSLEEMIDRCFPTQESKKTLRERDTEQVFRLCWRIAGEQYRAASETHSTSFALRNLSTKCFLGTLFMVVVIAPFNVAALSLLVASVAFLRQYVYYDGERARNVYDCFYAWSIETSKSSDEKHE